MRIKLTLHHKPNSTLPINYAYPISAMIYKMLAKANPEFSKWLHEQGWGYNGRQYKLFTFSRLAPTLFRIDGDRFILRESPTYLTISFMMDTAMGHFIEGLFNQQQFGLGDKQSQADFHVSSVEILPQIVFSESMKFKLTSPIVISSQSDVDKHAQYLHPIDNAFTFKNQFFSNLLNKYIAYHGTLDNNIDLQLNKAKFRMLSKPASRLITIKSDTPQATKIRGYSFAFELTAAPELMKIGYYSGFGEKGSMGFGFAEPY